jgi:predicted Zn-dependent protease with MMP-like domain
VLSHWPTGRRALSSALVCACTAIVIVTVFRGLARDFLPRLVQMVAIAAVAAGVLGLVIATITRRMADYHDPEDEDDFEALVRRSERLAREDLAPEPDDADFDALDPHDAEDFEELVRQALDDLPDILRKALDHVPVIISDDGRRHQAYGLYIGDTIARDDAHDRIVVFRDTLRRDFGHDPGELRDQVTRTVRHELAHHLGADELGVRELGL